MRALVILCLLATPAVAEINMADSIEWATADSEVVVRGFVTAVKLVRPHLYDVTFQITESIKGGVKQSLHFGAEEPSEIHPPLWLERQTDLLVFLVDANRLVDEQSALARFSYTLRPAQGETWSAFELGVHRAFTAKFTVLEQATDILAVVRAAARSTATRSHRVDLPWDSAAMQSLYSGSAVWLTLPVDAQLEQTAVGWIADANARARLQGVFAIQHFRSPENIERVTKLLADTDKDVRGHARKTLWMWHVTP